MSDVEHEKKRTQELLRRVDAHELVGFPSEIAPVEVAGAQVHATLALVGVLESIDAHLCGIQKLLNGKEGVEDE